MCIRDRCWFSVRNSSFEAIRNNFLDDGLLLCDGTELKKDTIENLLQKQTENLTFYPTVTGRSRQNIRFAAQLFSNRTAKALKHVANKERESSFIELVNDAFDVLNSRLPKDQKMPLRSGYGMNFKT